MSRPRLKLGRHLLPGVVAVALFVVLAFTFVNAPLAEGAGFGSPSMGVTESIGYAMFDLTAQDAPQGKQPIPSEGFLVTFEIIDVVLVAALAAAVMLARRDPEGLTTALSVEDDDEGGEP